MRSALKNVASVILGFIVASVVMMLVEMLNGHVLYPELSKAARAATNPEAVRALMASVPTGAMVVVLLGWLLGGVAGGWVTGRIAAAAGLRHALILGVLLTLAGIANNLMLPPPLWFWVAGMLVLGPAAYLGGVLAGRR